MNYLDLDKTEAFKKLKTLSPEAANFDFKKLLSPERIKKCELSLGGGLIFNWAARAVDDKVLEALGALAEEQELIAKYKALLEGEVMNTGEGRKVLHHLLRSPSGKSATGKAVIQEGDAGKSRDLGEFYKKELERLSVFAEKVRSGDIGPAPGKRYTAFCQIGIGGSDLGPRAMSLALENWAAGEGRKAFRAEFISNVDPDDA